MKSFKTVTLLFFYFALSNTIYPQGRSGLTVGYTNYVLDSNVLFTKSQPGYSIGIIATVPFNDHLELLVELNYTHHRSKFIGRADIDSEPEDLSFKLENINLSAILNYNFISFYHDDLKFGVSAGITCSFFQNYVLADDSKENYLLDPIYLKTQYLKFDEQNSSLSINAYLPMGVSAEYRNVMCNFRYNMGLTDPFRQAPFYNTAYETKSKQNYYSLSFVYFWE